MASAAARTPSGRLIANTARQPTCSVRYAPSTGPEVLANANTVAKYPEKRPRSRGETCSPMSAWANVIRPPPPRPCNARARMSASRLCARAHAAEAIVNTANAPRSMRRRPKRSPRWPYNGAATVAAIRYATTTHDKSARPPSELAMVGKALARIV